MTLPPPPEPETLLAHAAFVRAVARATIKDDDLAEDVVQETWLAALGDGAKRRGPLRGWLAGVTRRQAANLARRREAQRRRERQALRPVAVASAAELAIQAELGRRVVAAVLALPEAYRDVLLLRYFEDLPPREIAAQLEMPVETVRTRIKRGLGRLREQLDESTTAGGQGWRAALLPLAGVPAAAKGAPLSVGAILAGGIVGKNIIVALVALLLIGLGGSYWLTSHTGGPQDAAKKTALETTELAADGEGSSPVLAGRVGASDEAHALTRSDWTVRGLVLTPNGEPVAGVALLLWHAPVVRSNASNALSSFDRAWLRHDPNTQPVATTTSGADGHFSFSAKLSGRQMIIEARPTPPLVGTSAYVGVEGARSREVVVVVLPGGPMRGRVLDADGKGVQADIAFSMHGPPGLHGAFASFARRGTSTDAEGRFALAALPAGLLSVEAHVPGRIRRTWTIGLPHEGEALFRLYAADAAQVSGAVTDMRGKPIAGVRVLVKLRAQADASWVQALATTTDAGLYRCTELPPGVLANLVFDAPGYQPGHYLAHGRALGAGETHTIDRVLRRGATLEGHARTAAGAPIEGVRVHVNAIGGHDYGSSLSAQAVTDSEGSYRIEGLPHEAPARICAEKQGFYQPAQKAGVVSGALPTVLDQPLDGDERVTTLDIVLVPGIALEGRTITTAGLPVARAEVSLKPYYKQAQELLGYGSFLRTYATVHSYSDEEGRFRLAGLPPGTRWHLTACSADLRLRATEIIEAVPESGPIQLVLGTSLSIEGVVVLPDGTPAPGLEVMSEAQEESAQTGIGGRFALSGLSPGLHRIRVGSGQGTLVAEPIEVTLTEEAAPRKLRITTRAPLITTGRLLASDGTPLASARAALKGAARRGGMGRRIRTDADGRFEFRHWKPGTCRIWVGRDKAGEAFELGARDLELRLQRGKQSQIRVRILGPDGEPVPRCTLLVMTGTAGGKSGSYKTVDGGDCVLRTASLQEETDLTVQQAVDAQGKPLNVGRMTLRAVDTSQSEIVIRLEAAREVTGQVVDVEGAPVPGVTVGAIGSGRYGFAGARTDSEGRFTLVGLAQKALKLKVGGHGPWLPADVPVAAGQDEVRIVLLRGSAYTVEVVGPDGSPVADVKVALRSSGPAVLWRRRGQTDESGLLRVEGIPGDALLCIDLDTNGAASELPSTRRDRVPYGSGKIRIALANPVWIEGVVLDDEGEPVGGVRVSVAGKSAPEPFAVNSLHTKSGAKTGTFRLGPLEEGTYRVTAAAMLKLGLVGTGQVQLPSPSSEVRLVLPRAVSVEGRLHVADISGWYVSWYDGIQWWVPNLSKEGHFRLERVADLPGILWARGSGGRYALIENVRPGAGPFALKPQKGGRIQGRIEGTRIQGQAYYVTALQGKITLNTPVGEDGAFLIEGVPPGRWRVSVYFGGKELSVPEDVERDGEPLVLQINAPADAASEDAQR